MLLLVGGASMTLTAAGAQDPNTDQVGAPEQRAIWDLALGTHAREMPAADFIDYACGTNGGPPSLPLKRGWADYALCRAEPETGFREIYVRYDDELEYWARAHNLDMQVQRFQHTAAFGIPIIASALFDGDGFFVGFRMASDPRVDVATRELGVTLGAYLMARYSDADWACGDLPRLDGEAEYQGTFIKERCTGHTGANGVAVDVVTERHQFRRRGQATIDPREHVPTEGQFDSTTWFQAVMADPIEDREKRLAEIEALGPLAPDPVWQQARNCPGCDLRGANLKRADLSGANLVGADLTGANLHGATLSNADLSNANLSGANINRATLKNANLKNANLREAMLYASALDGADLSGADLSGALAGRIMLPLANLSDAKLFAVDLRNSRLNDANFSGADLTRSWLHNAQLTRANLTGATLIYVLARQANMVSVNLSGVDARGADFYGANLRDADMTEADFSYTLLTLVNLAAAKLDGTKLIEAELPAGFTPR